MTTFPHRLPPISPPSQFSATLPYPLNISLALRSDQCTQKNPRALADHYRVAGADSVVELKASELETPLVLDLRFGSAKFSRSMTEYAAAEGVRYQFDGPKNMKSKLGWNNDAYKHLVV